MGWFGGGDKDKKANDSNGGSGKPASKGGIRIATNAPRHWPPVVVDAWVTKAPALNYIILGAALKDALQPTGATLAFYQERLYDDGVLVVPLMVTEGEQRTAVFAYARGDAAAAAHYSGVRGVLRQREGINAVYYAPESIQPATPSKVVEDLDTPNFQLAEKERPPAEYALWWPTPEDPSFASSAALKHLDRWFEAVDGYAAYLFTAFVRTLKLANEPADAPPRLYALPGEGLLVPVDAPGGLRAYLKATSDQQKLWIALDVTTPAAQRNTLLKLLADLATRVRATAETHGLPAHQKGALQGWWRMTRTFALQKDAAGEKDFRIGVINEFPAKPGPEAAPAAAEERSAPAAANGSPDPALVEFAGVLMDRARMMASQSYGSEADDKLPAPGEPALPSIPPMLSMQTGADTWTVVFWDDETPEATAAARELIAEHAERGPVDMAAFVCDIMLTVGGTRTDALFVRVQDRGDDRAHAFMQRYVPRRRGQSFGLTGRWALMGREEPIYPAAGAAATNGHPNADARPSAHAIARAHASIADMITWITFDDGKGARTIRRENGEDRPLLSPRLLLEGADDPGQMIMFGLMGEAAGRRAATRAAQESADARIACFRYDHVRLKNGHPQRELRVVVHERGTPRAFLFAQGYEMPREEAAFAASGDITLIGPVAPLFAD